MENRASVFGIIAIIIGASGLGLGAYSIVNFQTVEGPQGLPGDDGQDGQDIVGLQVGILDPDQYEIISGLVEVRILLWNSSECSIYVYINGSLHTTSVPWMWNTTTVSDGWWNVSVRAMDTESNSAQDEILVYVLNNPDPIPRARVYSNGYGPTSGSITPIDYHYKVYDSTNDFNLTSDSYTTPENGYYFITTAATLLANMNPTPHTLVRLFLYVDSICVAETHVYFDLYSLFNELYTISISDLVYLSEGDIVQVLFYYSQSSSPVSGGSSQTFFCITKLSD